MLRVMEFIIPCHRWGRNRSVTTDRRPFELLDYHPVLYGNLPPESPEHHMFNEVVDTDRVAVITLC